MNSTIIDKLEDWLAASKPSFKLLNSLLNVCKNAQKSTERAHFKPLLDDLFKRHKMSSRGLRVSKTELLNKASEITTFLEMKLKNVESKTKNKSNNRSNFERLFALVSSKCTLPWLSTLCPNNQECPILLNRNWIREEYEPDFVLLKAVLDHNSHFKQLRSVLAKRYQSQLSSNPKSIEMILFGYSKTTSAYPKIVSSMKYYPTCYQNPFDYNGIVVFEVTTCAVCSLSTFRAFVNSRQTISDYLASCNKTDAIVIRKLIFKLLQLERQATLIRAHYGRDPAAAFLIAGNIDEISDPELANQIISVWYQSFPILAALHYHQGGSRFILSCGR